MLTQIAVATSHTLERYIQFLDYLLSFRKRNKREGLSPSDIFHTKQAKKKTLLTNFFI